MVFNTIFICVYTALIAYFFTKYAINKMNEKEKEKKKEKEKEKEKKKDPIKEFKQFFNNRGIYNLYSYYSNTHEMRPVSSNTDNTINTVYVNIRGTEVIYPLPYSSCLNYPFFQRQLDGTMEYKGIPTPDGNVLLYTTWDYQSEFKNVYRYIIDGKLEYMDINSSLWKSAKDVLMYFLGVDSPDKSS
tara:strand:+ start:717 stop:1277 length:561 start_codon:yes stop_codon:yes gene_type:complete